MAAKDSSIRVKIAGDVDVCVPDNIHLMTSYVLQEQLDWFEDEIRFLRCFIRPGNHMVDIGANYGVYTLSAAKLVGPEGSVTAFEPSRETAAWLRRSIEANGFGNIHVVEAAVSDRAGHGSMLTSENSELNRLAEPGEGSVGESVALTTLDDALRELTWPRIDFVKIDAEGHEMNVIQGGRRFFETRSPLVMLEIKAGDKFDFGPLRHLQALGYSLYRLVPGLRMLVPFDNGETIDGYQLNMFCCKSDRAQRLEKQGHLVPAGAAELPELDGNDWIDWMERFPYGQQQIGIWKERTSAKLVATWDAYRRALNAYVRAHSASESLARRYACLRFAFRELASLVASGDNHARLLSFARVAAEFGARQQAVKTLENMVRVMTSGTIIYAGEPFLPVSPDLEQVNPGLNFAKWIGASVLERLVSLGSFSGYFAPGGTADIVPTLIVLGFSTPSMERRLKLFRRRFPELSVD